MPTEKFSHDDIRNIIKDYFDHFYSRMRYTKDDAQSIPNATATKIEYDDIDYDSLTEYDTTNYRFIATYAGYYLVIASLLTADVAWTAGNEIEIYIRKNGTTFSTNYKEIEANITAYADMSHSDVLYLEPDDYVEIFFYQGRGSATALYTNANYNFFTVHRIG